MVRQRELEYQEAAAKEAIERIKLVQAAAAKEVILTLTLTRTPPCALACTP